MGCNVRIDVCVWVGAGVGETVRVMVGKGFATAVPVSVMTVVRVGGRVADTTLSGVQAPKTNKNVNNPKIFTCVLDIFHPFYFGL